MKIIPDAKIIEHAARRLSSSGVRAPSRVTVTSTNGNVTLAGTLQYENQRQAAMRAVMGVEGVRRVVDQLKIADKVKRT